MSNWHNKSTDELCKALLSLENIDECYAFLEDICTIKEVLDIFLEKTPDGVNLNELKVHLTEIDGVLDVHHIHIRSIDGYNNYITLHVVAKGDSHNIKHKIREELSEHGINHATIELESEHEHCHEKECHIEHHETGHHYYHHR